MTERVVPSNAEVVVLYNSSASSTSGLVGLRVSSSSGGRVIGSTPQKFSCSVSGLDRMLEIGSVWNKSLSGMMSLNWAQCYQTFYVRKLRNFVIS
jgi:hypothetical protein